MVKPGYKQTEVGIIPEAWDISSLAAAFPKLEAGVSVNSDNTLSSEYHVLKTSAVHDGVVDVAETKPIVPQDYHRVKCPLVKGSMVISRMNTPTLVGECGFVKNAKDGIYLPDRLWQVKNPPGSSFDFEWLNYLLNTEQYRDAVRATATGTSNSMKNISKERLLEIKIPHPPLYEERQIASVLSEMDELIQMIEHQLSKQVAIKQGVMQELLTGKKRLPGFHNSWQVKQIEDIAVNLDSYRVPVKESDREAMVGNIPYCGANGVLGYVNDYTIDDSIILIAEDGGHFDEYATKPIAYQMNGKCWVNNHAHIIKAKPGTNQQFLFYSLVHKDIRDYITSGTRAKLNKSELAKITVTIPTDTAEQQEIATILSMIDAEIDMLEQKIKKYRQVKQGVMQQLMTGKIRLVD